MLAGDIKIVSVAQGVWIALAVLVPLAAITVTAYVRWAAALKIRRGRVETDLIGPPDMFVTLFLVSLMGTIACLGFAAKELPELSLTALAYDSLFKLVILVALFTFLAFRKVNPVTLFGLRRVPPLRALGWAILFLAAALPAMIAMAFVVTKMTGSSEEQQLVTFFRTLAKGGNRRGELAVFGTAVLMAPYFEETLFRGYFYTTLKRYCGPVSAATFVSALFALFHANLNSLPALFLLALCLTVAYEWTGSLLVTMLMHALFNTIGLVGIYWEALHTAP